MYPRGMGFRDRHSDKFTVHLQDQFLGEQYVTAFAEGLKVGKDIRSIIIRGASLKTAGGIKIIDSMILKRIHTLDFSNNP